MFVIKKTATNKYVARSDQEHIYTRDLAKMRIFATHEEAHANCLSYEIVQEIVEQR